MAINRKETARPTCNQCKRALKRARRSIQGRNRGMYGRFADDLFCGLRCGYAWAIENVRGLEHYRRMLAGQPSNPVG